MRVALVVLTPITVVSSYAQGGTKTLAAARIARAGVTVTLAGLAVLALIPDPARVTQTVTGRCVALAIQARFVTFLQPLQSWQSTEQPKDREKKHRFQHRETRTLHRTVTQVIVLAKVDGSPQGFF